MVDMFVFITSSPLRSHLVKPTWRSLPEVAAVAAVLATAGCSSSNGPPAATLVCGSTSTAAAVSAPGACGVGDPTLPPEPTLPTTVCATLTANKSTPDESNLDTAAIHAALAACKGIGPVKLTSSGTNNAFVSGNLILDSTILWIDRGTTLYASRNPFYYNNDGNCGLVGISDSSACAPLISVTGANAGVVGDGVIDGQGGEPLVGQNYSWWDLSNALRSSNGSGPNPALIEVKKATNFLMYRITLHNSPKAHVKLQSAPATGTCAVPGSGFTIWGVTILTPSTLTNSLGFPVTPFYARNTDGFDPGESSATSCGVIACTTISTGDDQIAIKGAHGATDIVIAHSHFGTGHGMSIGSETNGGVANIDIHDLTVDGSSRWTGAPASDTGDFNGIRVKSDESRGGPVSGISFSDVCVRDVINAIVINSSYNPLFSGTLFPQFHDITINNFHGVTCVSQVPQVVNLEGFNTQYPAGPITLNNVIVDGITPLDLAAQFASITLGTGDVNFRPSGPGVSVTNHITGSEAPAACSFPQLPVPE
jgi:polygalacturonase